MIILVNYVAQLVNPLNTENPCLQNLAVGSQLDKKASEVVLNAVLTGKSASAEYWKSRYHKTSVKLIMLLFEIVEFYKNKGQKRKNDNAKKSAIFMWSTDYAGVFHFNIQTL